MKLWVVLLPSLLLVFIRIGEAAFLRHTNEEEVQAKAHATEPQWRSLPPLPGQRSGQLPPPTPLSGYEPSDAAPQSSDLESDDPVDRSDVVPQSSESESEDPIARDPPSKATAIARVENMTTMENRDRNEANTPMFHARAAAKTKHAVYCVDNDPSCASWAAMGECTNNPNFMLQSCQKSCGACSEGGTKGVKLAPGVYGHAEQTSDGSAVHFKFPHRQHNGFWQAFWGKSWMYALLLFLPYACATFILAAIWIHLGGRIEPSVERTANAGRTWEYGLFDTEHILNHQMWICVCAFCCCPIRMADTYSKYGKTKPIINGFWVALAITLFMAFLVDISSGLACVLFLGAAVYFRQKIRERYGLPRGGNTIAWDCLYWCCCPWCTVAQEARQVECAGVPPGLEEAVGDGMYKSYR